MPPIIRFDDVSITADQNTLLSQINFTVYPGQKVLITGKSGAGKSCLLKTVLGMYSLSAGTVYFREQALTRQSIQRIRSCTAYIGQEPVLGADSVREALLLPFRFKAHRDRSPTEAQLRDVLHRLQLSSDVLDRETIGISGGEKQRIALARGLLLGKTIFLLDEATSALDETNKRAVFDICSAPEITLLAVSHDADWFRYSTAVFEMAEGKLLEIGQNGNY